jgi:MFS family permease
LRVGGNERSKAGRALIGTSLEWYDFFIYGTAAALVFNELFFPSFEPLVGTLLAFTTYAVGFVARPLGGIVCSATTATRSGARTSSWSRC